MTRLAYSEDLYQLLRRVAEGLVAHHDECEPHAPGFSWQAADMSLPIQELCGQANHARLLHIGLHHPWGSAVSLTPAGLERMEELRDRHNAEVRGVV
jgi:hypothetical protein